MDCVENMRGVLNAAGAYKLTGDSAIDQELEAYGVGLKAIEEQAQRLENDLFAVTAGEERLGVWERLYRRQPSWADSDTRRRGVAAALSRRGGPVLPGDMEGILAAAGIRGAARIEGGRLLIHAEEYVGVTEIEAHKILGRMLPLHLGWEIENT